MEKSKGVIVYIFYAILVLTWGSSFILMKIGLEFYTPIQVATIRQVSALIVLAGLAVFNIRHIPLNKLGFILLTALLGIFIPAYLFCYAEAGISSAIAGILNALTPVFTLVLGALFFKQQILRMQLVGLAIGIIGIALLVLVNAKGQLDLNHFGFFVILATISYGLNINIVKTHLGDLNPLHVTTVAVMFAGFASLIYPLVTGGFQVWPLTQQNKIPLIASITLGVFGTAMAQLLFYHVIKRSSPVFTSSIVFALPIVAIFWGLLDGEKILAWHYVGMAFIAGAIVVIKRAK
jgi:drug/metabolite transporter (DMT)-like permease